jgi:malonate-semialdehyde dehydrogenase (acetylating) / methylmalonate-semialdehyde dehydrogenase
VAKAVYARGAGNGKRVQCMGGAKNHGVILPDADLDQAVADILAGAFGSAGQRCMAMPVIVPVGEKTAKAVRECLLQEIPKMRIGGFTDSNAQMGPVVTPENKKKIEGYIQLAVDEGADLVIDGRGRSLPGQEEGFFLWPTLIDHATRSMKSYQDEIFGPVLQIVRAETFEEALTTPTSIIRATRLRSLRRAEMRPSVSLPRSRWVWWASIFRCRRRSATTAMAAGRTQLSATLTNMARTASASSRAPRS